MYSREFLGAIAAAQDFLIECFNAASDEYRAIEYVKAEFRPNNFIYVTALVYEAETLAYASAGETPTEVVVLVRSYGDPNDEDNYHVGLVK